MSGVDVLAVLDAAQFSAQGYCRTCAGWEVIKGQGECPRVHTPECGYVKARAAVAELIEAAEAVAFVQINRRSVANDLGKAKQLRLRAALANVQGAK